MEIHVEGFAKMINLLNNGILLIGFIGLALILSFINRAYRIVPHFRDVLRIS